MFPTLVVILGALRRSILRRGHNNTIIRTSAALFAARASASVHTTGGGVRVKQVSALTPLSEIAHTLNLPGRRSLTMTATGGEKYPYERNQDHVSCSKRSVHATENYITKCEERRARNRIQAGHDINRADRPRDIKIILISIVYCVPSCWKTST